MKLLYLWIKSYKNIDEMGIPLEINHYEFKKTEYNISNNHLSIHLSTADNYNVFGDNLNIKTIVGANGSGKSNIVTALCSILRSKVRYDSEDYFDNSMPDKYCLIYSDNENYQYISNCKNIDLYVDNEIQNLKKGEFVNCGLFRPFLNIEDDTSLSFPLDVHIDEITERKIKNYFYYDRFRMYDTSQALKNLFKENKNKKFEILSRDNKYLVFDYYGYEINIVQEFKWINRQLSDKIPLYFKKENIQSDNKKELLSYLLDINSNIIKHVKIDSYHNVKNFVDKVVSPGCFMFLLIKIAELFSMLKDFENIITLSSLKNVSVDMFNLTHNDKYPDIPIRHSVLRDFYKKIQVEFEEKIKDKSIREQFKDDSYLKNISCLINSLIELEENLSNNKSRLYDILETKDGNLFRLNDKKYLNHVTDDVDTKENTLLNNIGIFRRSYYKDKTNNEYYSFYDLSTGEQRLLRFFADVLSLQDKNTDVFIFDEMDLSWHPEWQRKMVYFIKDFFEKCSNGCKNIIFTTHSPFILSDMPLYNTLMLYRDSSGNGKLYENTSNSFCANIHDLFNDNFFLGNCNGICTIGEFAQNYINKIKYEFDINNIIYDNDKLKKLYVIQFPKFVNDLYNRIQLIGEPVIRKSLMKEFLERYGYMFFNDSTKLMLDYLELKNEYNKLKKEFDEKNKSDR